MIKIIVLSVLFFVSLTAQSRTYHSFNDEWLFKKLDNPDNQFQKIRLPHTFNTTDADDGGSYYRGTALYKKTFSNPCAANEIPYIEFSSATTRAKVELNNQLLGIHEGGYTRFRFPLHKKYLRNKNEIKVTLDNKETDYIAPLGGDFSIFGGITRDVQLICAGLLHFDLDDYGSDGVYIKSNLDAEQNANVIIRTKLNNRFSRNLSAQLKMEIMDHQGKTISTQTFPLSLKKYSRDEQQYSVMINKPHLWNGVKDPALYTARLSIINKKSILDSINIHFGIRTIRIDANEGLFLNGAPYKAYGVNLHLSQRPGKGTAVTRDEELEDFKMLDELKMTAIRLSHYPHPQAIYQHANQTGYLVWSEIPLVATLSHNPEFLNNAIQQLKEMIRQNYNHPSVFVWGLGNEIYNADENANAILKRLQQVAKEEDPDRFSVYANCCGPVTQPIATHTDLSASNIYHGWYPQQSGTMNEWLDQAHAELNGRALAVSEYGAGGSALHQEDPPTRPITDSNWHPEQYQSIVHEQSWQAIESKPYLWASFIWVAFDFASDSRKEGDQLGINDKGLITYDRKTKKDAYFWYQANWSTKPVAYITSRRFNYRKSPDATVKVYSNQNELQLHLNGKLISSQKVQDKIATWKIHLTKGKNLIQVKTSDGIAGDSIEWNLE
jgi:beta-galactosidase/beta-glucuronidase